MTHHIPSVRTIASSLIVAMSVITAGVPVGTQAATPAPAPAAAAAGATAKVPVTATDKRKIGEANDLKLKARDPSYPQHAKSLAEQYRETADMVARNGGNAQPLLDAAARLDNQSATISQANQKHPLPIQAPDSVVRLPKQAQ